MIQKYTYKKLTWIDIKTPTKEDVSAIISEYGIHPVVGEELLKPTLKPKIDVYKNYLYLVLHFPMARDAHEIDFIIGKDVIITSRYDEVEPLHNFSKIFEVNSILDKSDMGEHAGFIFYYMLKRLYKDLSHNLETIEQALYTAEKRIFLGEEKSMVVALSNINRDLIDVRHCIQPHESVLNSFEKTGKDFFGDDFVFYIDDMIAEFYKINESLLNNKELLTDLRETNDSLLTTKQNETMKILTLMAFITFPLSLITDLFSMNVSHAPIIGARYDFEIIVIIMVCATLAMFGFFKHKKWL